MPSFFPVNDPIMDPLFGSHIFHRILSAVLRTGGAPCCSVLDEAGERILAPVIDEILSEFALVGGISA